MSACQATSNVGSTPGAAENIGHPRGFSTAWPWPHARPAAQNATQLFKISSGEACFIFCRLYLSQFRMIEFQPREMRLKGLILHARRSDRQAQRALRAQTCRHGRRPRDDHPKLTPGLFSPTRPKSSSALSICSASNRNCSQSSIKQSRKYNNLIAT
jgi:hypothetical protein